jgi:hypothetical protein
MTTPHLPDGVDAGWTKVVLRAGAVEGAFGRYTGTYTNSYGNARARCSLRAKVVMVRTTVEVCWALG